MKNRAPFLRHPHVHQLTFDTLAISTSYATTVPIFSTLSSGALDISCNFSRLHSQALLVDCSSMHERAHRSQHCD